MAGTSGSLIQSLGLQPAIDIQNRQSQQLAQNVVNKGTLDGLRVTSKARRRHNIFSTVGSLLGAAGGAIATGGSPQGAAVGAKLGGELGGAASGVSSNVGAKGEVAQGIQQGFQLADTLVSFGKQIKANKAAGKSKKFKQDVGILKDLKDQKLYTDESINSAINSSDLSKLKVSNSSINITDVQKKSADKQRDFVLKNESYIIPKSAITSAEEVFTLLDSDNPISDNTAVFKMARAAQGPGVLTENDLKPFKGSQALNDQLVRIGEKIKTGKLSKRDRDYLRQASNTIHRAAARNLNAFVQRESDFVLNKEGMTSEQLSIYFEPLKREIPELFTIKPETDPIINNIDLDDGYELIGEF